MKIVTQSSGVVRVPDALHLQPLQQEGWSQLPHQVHRHGIGLKQNTQVLKFWPRLHPQTRSTSSDLSDFRRPRHWDLVGHCGGQSDEGRDVQRTSRSLLLHAGLCGWGKTLREDEAGSVHVKFFRGWCSAGFSTHRQRKQLSVDLDAQTVRVVVLLRTAGLWQAEPEHTAGLQKLNWNHIVAH